VVGSAIAAAPAACSGRGGTDGEEVVHLADAAGDVRRRDRPPDPPAGDGVGLAQRVDGDRAVLEPRHGRRRHVPAVAEVVDVLVDLVGDAQTSCVWQSSLMSASSSRENTLPVGLCGVFTMMARVRSVNAARSSASSMLQSGWCSVHVARRRAGQHGVGP
jgi:hypothetical protein